MLEILSKTSTTITARLRIDNETIDCVIKKHPRSRRVRLIMKSADQLVVTLPRWGTLAVAERFILEKRSWIAEQIKYFENLQREMPKVDESKSFAAYKTAALRLVERRVEHFNKLYNLPYKSLAVKNQKTRWGSCSTKGNLNFNYRIAFLPPELADYLIVHELCHLQEMNHSPRFWNLVAKSLPDYEKLRAQLRKEKL